ncbi:MAG: hypothetical protein ACREDL_13870 [Bradyrhizobium sp.]
MPLSFDGVGDLHQLAGGGIRIGEGTAVDEFHTFCCVNLSKTVAGLCFDFKFSKFDIFRNTLAPHHNLERIIR